MPTLVDRPYIQLPTAELRELVERSGRDFDLLHTVYVELLFRERRAAGELRETVAYRLNELQNEYFRWPTTQAPLGDGEVDDAHFQYHQGLLGFVGYRVGAFGVSAVQRRELLDSVYSGPLPSLNSQEYMADWGAPQTSTRLRKIAASIAAFARNAKRRNPGRLLEAISEWEADLAYLKAQYYDNRFDHVFVWPETRP